MSNIKAFSPMVYEKTANGEEMYDIFSRLMKERILFIGEDIYDEMANILVAQLLYLDSLDSEKEISIYINSCGGDINAMFAIYDIIQYIKAPVCTYVIGIAASAAAILSSAGTKGYRFALPSSEIMIHQPWITGIGGTVTDVNIQNKQCLRSKRKCISILARHCGRSYEQVERDCERDMWMAPKDAVKYGLIDAISPVNKNLPELIHEYKNKRQQRRR